MEYTAHSTAPTPVSLTQHAYFNLSADERATIGEHTLHLPGCSAYCPDDGSGDGVPTGELRGVAGTCRDLRSPTRLAHLIALQAADTPLWPHGEQYVVDALRGRDPNAVALRVHERNAQLPVAAVLADPRSGRRLTVLSSEPVMQTYYATLLCATEPAKRGTSRHEPHAAVCLESHRPANAENLSPGALEALGYAGGRIVRPGQPYRQTTVWRFDCISTSDTT